MTIPERHTDDGTAALTGMELLILFLLLLRAAARFILGKEHIVCTLLGAFCVPALMFLAGLCISHYRESRLILLKKAAFYAVLYLFFGLCNLFLLHHKLPFRSLIQLAAMQKIPAPSELFFEAAVLFFICFLISGYARRLSGKKRLLHLAGLAALLMAYFPSGVFGYPAIGALTGCDTYDCIPLLPCLGYLIAGLFAEKDVSRKSVRRTAFLSVITTLASAALAATPLRPLALVTLAAAPVCAIHLFSQYCKPYQAVIRLLFRLRERLAARLAVWYQDFTESKKSALPLYFLVYTAVFLVMAVLVFFPFIENDISIAWTNDAITQYIPRVYNYINYIRECVSTLLRGSLDFPSYTFRSGLGNAVTMNYEPVYWLFALFRADQVELAYNCIAIFRYFLTGLSASVFLLYHRKGYFETLIGSMLYTFCQYAVYAGVLHSHFLAPMIFLPLLMIATEEIFQKKRWYLCTIFIALALPANYYFAYMSTIAMGIYYIARFLCTKDSSKKNWKYFFTASLTFAGSYLLGVVIGNISLFTSFTSYLNSARGGNKSMTSLSLFFYGESWPVKFFTYFISSPHGPGFWMRLGFIPLSYLALVILFSRRGKKFLKTLVILTLITSTFPVGAYVFSGFNSITNRWSYILALLVTYITASAIPELKNLSRRELQILSAALIPYMLIILLDRDFRTEETLCSLVLLLGTYGMILCMNRKIRLIGGKTAQTALALLCGTALVLNAYYQYTIGDATSKKSFAKQGEVLNILTDTPLKVFDGYPDDSFYRVASTDVSTCINSALVMNYNSITTFSSTINGDIFNYNTQMGNTAWNIIRLFGFDNRAFLNSLASVKYYGSEKENDPRIPYGYRRTDSRKIDGRDCYVYQSDYALPLGYTYDSVLTEDELLSYSHLERPEVMLQSAVVDSSAGNDLSSAGDILSSTGNDLSSAGDDLSSAGTEPSLTSVKAEITDYQADGLKIDGNTVKVKRPGATLTLFFSGVENAETYLVYNGVCNPGKNNKAALVKTKMKCDGCTRSYDFRSTNHTYNTGQETFLFNLGYHEGATDSCTVKFQNTGTFTVDSLEVYCQPMDSYASYIDALSENTLENVDISGNTITGNISVDREKFLVLSIPYQNGWTAYVDGKKTELQKANLMYMGLPLTPGSHDIRLHFERPGIRMSLILSACGTVIFIIALIIRRRRIKIMS